MKQGLTNYYQPEYLWKIMKGEEKCGKLRKGYYSAEVEKMSKKLKRLREECRKKGKNSREDIKMEISELRARLDEEKQKILHQKSRDIANGKAKIEIETKDIKGNQAYIANNLETTLVAQIIKLELRRSYKLYPANMDMIIEQIKALLDNPMPKIVIRADIKHFFESIPQQELIDKLGDDGYISRQTVKYLKTMLYAFNEKGHVLDGVGLPRGLAFSSHLSELYMQPFDEKIKSIDGVYYYKRYVDDIIIVADSLRHSRKEYWSSLTKIFDEKLKLHEDSEKKYIKVLDGNTPSASFNYLGYSFSYKMGTLSLGLSQKRFTKYIVLLDAIFEIYDKCSHYRKYKAMSMDERQETHFHKKDALQQLFERLEILTSNGLLSGRKNNVATGIFFSNKYLTDLEQLYQLDEYYHRKIENFNPPNTLFSYSPENNYEYNLAKIKQKLYDLSFVKGFQERKIHKHGHFSRVLLDLQRIYNSRKLIGK